MKFITLEPDRYACEIPDDLYTEHFREGDEIQNCWAAICVEGLATCILVKNTQGRYDHICMQLDMNIIADEELKKRWQETGSKRRKYKEIIQDLLTKKIITWN